MGRGTPLGKEENNMKYALSAGAFLLLGTAMANAAGIDRSGQPVGLLWEEGDAFELSFGAVDPSISGTVAIPGVGVLGSGDMAESYNQIGLGFKKQLNDQWSVTVMYDQPFGADVAYPTGTNYPLAGTTADLNSDGITGVAKYQINDNFSVYGGARMVSVGGDVEIYQNGALTYTGEFANTSGTGYVAGAAYERKDIALRVALTYSSEIDLSIPTMENGNPSLNTDVTLPDSWNLDFQSGIMADTLLFGSVRYVDWSEFDITPFGYNLATGDSLVDYANDGMTYSLGVGRRFTDDWSAAITLSYEESNGGLVSNLGPTDGNFGVGLGATYQVQDNAKITFGMKWVDIGDANTDLTPAGLPAGAIQGQFTDNSATAFGVKLVTTF